MRIRILGQHVPATIAALALIEAALSFVAAYAAMSIRFPVNITAFQTLGPEVGDLWPPALMVSAVMLMSVLAFGLYSSRQRVQLSGTFVRLVMALVVASGAVAAVFYLIPSLHLLRGVALLAVILAGCAILTSRALFPGAVAGDIFKRRVLVYGAGATAAAAVANLRRSVDRRAFLLVGFVQAPGEERALPAERVLDASGGLRALCERLDITEVVVAMDDRRRAFPIPELLDCRVAGVDVTELPTFLERETGRIRIDVLNPSWMIFGQGFRRDPLRRFASRLLDVLASLVVLTVALPAMLLTVIAIKLEDGWRAPALYTQARVGFGGRMFNLVKLRSMRLDAESNGAQWAQLRDPRITRVGAVIRKLRIDELPQIFNVLRGDMSFVGPRPERPEFVAELAKKIPYYHLRECVKPGITGWAQLCYPYGSCEQDAIEKLQYDLFYIKNNSLLFDLVILVETAEVVLLGKGAR